MHAAVMCCYLHSIWYLLTAELGLKIWRDSIISQRESEHSHKVLILVNVGLGPTKNKVGDRPARPAKTATTPIFIYIFLVTFLLNLLKLHLNDSGFCLGLVLKCLLSMKLLLVFNQIFLSYNKHRYMYFHHWHHTKTVQGIKMGFEPYDTTPCEDASCQISWT